MAKILISPSKYLQGAGEMKKSELMRQTAEKSTGSDQQRRL